MAQEARSVGRLGNAAVEIAMVIASLVAGWAGAPVWAVAVTIAASLAWWGMIHRARLAAFLSAAPGRLAATAGIAALVTALAHALGFGIGAALHAAQNPAG